MTKAEIVDYLYANNVRGDFSIEQMAEDLDRPQGEWEMQEIVRCKECKYYKDEWCYWRDVEIRADDFCSYGERSE